PIFIIPMLAFLGAGTTAAFIYAFAYRKQDGITPGRMVLVGIAISAGIVAATLVLSIRLDPADYQFVSVWLTGSIWGTSWKFVLAMLPWVTVLLPYAFYKARVLDVLNLEEQTAVGLGVSLARERLLMLFCAVALAGAGVAVGGAIGFVGFIAPH